MYIRIFLALQQMRKILLFEDMTNDKLKFVMLQRLGFERRLLIKEEMFAA